MIERDRRDEGEASLSGLIAGLTGAGQTRDGEDIAVRVVREVGATAEGVGHRGRQVGVRLTVYGS